MKRIYKYIAIFCYYMEQFCRMLAFKFMFKGNYYSFKSREGSFKNERKAKNFKYQWVKINSV